MPLVLKTLKTFFLVKTRNGHHRIHKAYTCAPISKRAYVYAYK